MTVLEALFSGDDQRAAAAAERATEADLPALLWEVAGREPDRRWWAACALARVPGAAATNALIGLAADADEGVRAVALHGLGQRRTPEGIPALLANLADANAYLAWLATGAIVRVGKTAVPGLITALEQAPEQRARANAARALALLRDPAAIPALFRALEADSALVCRWAEEGLEMLGVGQVYFRP